MSLGVIILAHRALNRVTDLARHLATNGCPVVIHIDYATPDTDFGALEQSVSDLDNVRFAPRERSPWGQFGIIRATLGAAQTMLDDFPEVGRVLLASGSCLPLRPVSELQSYLNAHPVTDFIESVQISDVIWAQDGLEQERFTLRFPFSWKSQRRLFDGYVALQRRLGVRRKIPHGITPHVGSQWWCLTRQTLRAILSDPRRADFDRYFNRVWIPDESYFQTLVREHSGQIESRSLTLSKFDHRGKPHVFYDDHLNLLRRSDCFVARKIWPNANALYQAFFNGADAARPDATPNPGRIDRLFTRARNRRVNGRPGLYMQGRFPRHVHARALTAQPYTVLQGFEAVFRDFRAWLGSATGLTVHGHLFAEHGAEFAGGGTTWRGALPSAPALRDYDPRAFLCNLIYSAPGQRQAFLFGPQDAQGVSWDLALDHNAHISVISGAWALDLWRQDKPLDHIRERAARYQERERAHLDILRTRHSKTEIRIWTLSEVLEAPYQALEIVLKDVPGFVPEPRNMPPLTELTGFDIFLQKLRNAGTNLYLVGDVTAKGLADCQRAPHRRDYFIR